jgi:hypothetical protein
LSPGNVNALVERSSCYLKIGKNDLALADAEESLKENREFTKVKTIFKKKNIQVSKQNLILFVNTFKRVYM